MQILKAKMIYYKCLTIYLSILNCKGYEFRNLYKEFYRE